MKPRTISEAVVRRCLLLHHRTDANSFPNDIVYILSKVATDIVKELLYRSAINAEENCSERVMLENLHRVIPQAFYDFNL
uniref:Centromere protein X n=1 Tax=Setaria digitata TaxID=48799 RepID=A0A915Q1I8_9BILA